ncbi:heme exporter protein CcmD [Magnetovirga frankeli]|uniref:heme exporter protein CcmD n=1 Tax=Magnetovirga frankeli TaxID=947516 RepID=UPI001292CE47|nr:heme exporter protein CcmD [gamma proteobacterium SS-5]
MAKLVEWLDMGGYALYVWGSFGATALLMVAEPLVLRSRRRQILRRLARISRLNKEETS